MSISDFPIMEAKRKFLHFDTYSKIYLILYLSIKSLSSSYDINNDVNSND